MNKYCANQDEIGRDWVLYITVITILPLILYDNDNSIFEDLLGTVLDHELLLVSSLTTINSPDIILIAPSRHLTSMGKSLSVPSSRLTSICCLSSSIVLKFNSLPSSYICGGAIFTLPEFAACKISPTSQN